MKCLLWNVQWASPSGKAGRAIAETLSRIDPDVACFTEVTRTLLPTSGYLIESAKDYGYRAPTDRRKVVLWSKTDWSEVDGAGCPTLPSGRFVSGITSGIRFIGICIPWKDAHVRTGRRDRLPWDDHLRYLSGLRTVLNRIAAGTPPVCIMGDFNQAIPRHRQPPIVASELHAVLRDRFSVATSAYPDEAGRPLIDHIAVEPGLHVTIDSIIPRKTADGIVLSDHPGLAYTLTAR
jgi:endonuclease/exonuclease/phosphatase family metal-dependent hydrolase